MRSPGSSRQLSEPLRLIISEERGELVCQLGSLDPIWQNEELREEHLVEATPGLLIDLFVGRRRIGEKPAGEPQAVLGLADLPALWRGPISSSIASRAASRVSTAEATAPSVVVLCSTV